VPRPPTFENVAASAVETVATPLARCDREDRLEWDLDLIHVRHRTPGDRQQPQPSSATPVTPTMPSLVLVESSFAA